MVIFPTETSSIWRWYKHGCQGVKLQTAVVGGRRFTSRQAIERFIERTTEARDGGPPERAVSQRRQASIAAAERELEAAGI